MDTIEKRLSALRSLMAQNGLDAYLVVSDDFNSTEYVSGYFKCREYITGFTGSAGTALIFHDRAYLWTDSRYFIQAASELSGTEYILMKSGEKDVPTVTGYLKKLGGIRLGADARTLSASVTDELS
ncbi:MAG: aminopeptidase P family N-terminal domain-containing protein, partial [Ruminococcus sp.]|nr:aminopeptidase P family N-terminal domain-containing protein [Ruminococcus sp.]